MRKIKIFPVLLLAVLILAGCSSLSDEIKAQREGVPLWVVNHESPRGKISYIVSGTDRELYRARLIAISSLSRQLEEYLGYPLTEDWSDELSSTGAISDFGLEISNRYDKTEIDSSVSVYLLFTADEALLSSYRSEGVRTYSEALAEVNALLADASAKIEEGRDFYSVNDCLKAAVLVKDNGLTEFSAEELVLKAVSLLSKISVKITGAEPDKGRCTVSVSRKERFLSTKLKDAVFTATVTTGGFGSGSFEHNASFKTGSGGSFDFISYDTLLPATGSVVFEPDIDTDEVLRVLGDCAQVQSLLSAVDALKIVFDYSFRPVQEGQFVLSFTRYDEEGEAIVFDEEDFADVLLITLAQDNLYPVLLDIDDDSSDDVLYKTLSADCPDASYLIRCRSGVVETAVYGGNCNVFVNGSLEIRDLANDKVLFDSGLINVSGHGNRVEDAVKEATALYVEIVRYQIRRVVFGLREIQD